MEGKFGSQAGQPIANTIIEGAYRLPQNTPLNSYPLWTLEVWIAH